MFCCVLGHRSEFQQQCCIVEKMLGGMCAFSSTLYTDNWIGRQSTCNIVWETLDPR